MTAKQYPPGATLNKDGNGRGMKAVTKPLAKKRGASADRTEAIAGNRSKYKSASNIPTAEIATTIDPDKPLTDKARLFVKYWAQGESIPTASARAGYGDGATYAYKLARFPQAIALYNEEKRLYEEAAQMTRKKVMDGLLESIEMAKLMAEPATMVSGWREIGKMCGYYEPIKQRIEVNVTGNLVMERLDRMSDADLLRLIQEGAQQAPPEPAENDDEALED